MSWKKTLAGQWSRAQATASVSCPRNGWNGCRPSRAVATHAAWIYAFLTKRVDRLLFSVEMTPMDDPAKRIEIATKLLDECPGLGFKRPKSWHGVKNNYSRVSAVETILQWSEAGEPKSDAIRVAVKKTLDDLYLKLEKLALVLKPLCQLSTSATAREVPTDRANWEKRQRLVQKEVQREQKDRKEQLGKSVRAAVPPQMKDAEERLIERLRLAPDRQWAESFLDLRRIWSKWLGWATMTPGLRCQFRRTRSCPSPSIAATF